ncbi:hypothetical protein CANINC_002309 [Pichia inconspicua]|uniref:Thiamine phosphate synthase/TenI domain-containing protein n=1 Tax=Pichia inconspicua TaxID=52247 RepID=A0A4T0X1J6_9ASCO|nr:hypothetical protein CANINC_002309 [[Candida] inconspicua]
MPSKFDRRNVNYTLYLVTNSEIVPPDEDFYDQIRKGLENGVTVVQLREKNLDTGAFVERAKAVHELTKEFGVPLIINDRIDVALAVDAEGVHIGQDDMDPLLARRIIGNDKILGVSVRDIDELELALKPGVDADYIGIGAVYATKTKELKKDSMGIDGVRQILEKVRSIPGLKSVIIGGLSKYNITSTLRQCDVNGFNTDGVAVVSCIMAQLDAAFETRETLRSIELGFRRDKCYSEEESNTTPLVHFITNSVVQNFSANVCIAAGGSPVMSEFVGDFAAFAGISNEALVLNVGTPTNSTISVYEAAIKTYNANMKPIVFDPVGCAASPARYMLTENLLNLGYFTVIKGNLSELKAIADKKTINMRGVENVDENGNSNEIVEFLRKLAGERHAVIVLTGEVDYIIDGINWESVLRGCKVRGGNKLMSKITGSGCALGGVIAKNIAKLPYISAYEATVRSVCMYKEAGYLAGERSDGPGSFSVNFLDSLYQLNEGMIDIKNSFIEEL